jgi:hypothetical protein
MTGHPETIHAGQKSACEKLRSAIRRHEPSRGIHLDGLSATRGCGCGRCLVRDYPRVVAMCRLIATWPSHMIYPEPSRTSTLARYTFT